MVTYKKIYKYEIYANCKEIKMKLLRTLKEDKEIFKKRFIDFDIPIDIAEGRRMDVGVVDILFYCKNIQEYIEKSREIQKIIKNDFSYSSLRRKTKFKYNTLRFALDNLTINDIKDSYFDYMRVTGGPIAGHRSYPVAVRRREFLLSDNSNKILSFIEKSRHNPDDKIWSAAMYSEKGDHIKTIVSSLQNKEDEKDINVCELHEIRNYSLEKRLGTSS